MVVQKWLAEAGIGSVMKSFDQDKSGGISFSEFTSLVRPALKIKPCFLLTVWTRCREQYKEGSPAPASLLQARAGALLDGKFLEYREAWRKLAGSEDGTMGAAQIQQVFANLGNPLSESKLWKIFERYDTDQVNPTLPP